MGDPFAGGHAFRALGEHVRENYLDFDYTRGTAPEAAFLREHLRVPEDARVLDVACGLGRHARLLPWDVVGVDLTRGLLEVAARERPGWWVQAEVRALPFREAFDGAYALCEGGFGLLPTDADHVRMLREVHDALKPGAPFLLSALNALCMCHDESFDPLTCTMIDTHHVEDPQGNVAAFTLAVRAFTPREVVALAEAAGFEVLHVWGGTTGDFTTEPVTVEDPEMLALMRRPAGRP